MEDVTIDMIRMVQAAAANPNAGICLVNLEEKIQEAINRFDGELPVTLTSGTTLTEQMSIRPDEVIGYVTSVNGTTANIKLNITGVEMLKRNELSSTGVQFCSLADTTTGEVDRVVKAALGKLLTI